MLNNNYEMNIIIIILLIALVSILFFVSKAKKWQEKIVIIFLLGGTAIYGGIGISMTSVDNSYILSFASFIICEGVGLMLGHKMFETDLIDRRNFITDIASSKDLISFFAIIYWLIILILLVYPTNHIKDLFSIRIDLNGVIASRIAKRSDVVLYVLGLLSKIASPFYCIFLSKQRNKIIIVFLLLEAYINTAIDGYIGRTAIMMLLIEVILVTFLINNAEKSYKKHIIFNLPRIKTVRKGSDINTQNTYRIKKAILIFLIGFIVAIPFLVSYQYSRQGKSYVGGGFTEAFLFLADSEINYPQYYEACENLKGQVISPLEYLYWFITLPIPKELFSLPGTTSITYTFSSIIRGISFGETGFSVLLTSLLGEGIMIWGKHLCFIHGIFIGLVWGAINSFLTENKELYLYQILFIARTLNMVRGGTQGSISTIINGIIPFVVICFVTSNIAKSLSRSKII